MKSHKLILGALLIIVLVFGANSSVLAQANTGAAKTPEEIEAHKAELRAEKAEQIEAKRAEYEEMKSDRATELEGKQEQYAEQAEERQQEREESQEQRQEEIQERIQERVAAFADNLAERVFRYYQRLAAISGKIESRMFELETQGVDVTEAEAQLELADAALEDALDEANALVEEIRDYNLTDRQSLGELISMVRNANSPFKEVLEMYKEVVSLLREAVAESQPATAEPTEEVTE